MNKLYLTGRLTKDPEVRYTGQGLAVATFCVAVDRRTKDKQTDFFFMTSFNKTAEFIEKYCKKGTALVIEGHLQTDQYTDQSGQNKTVTKLIADQVEFGQGNSQAKPEEKKSDDGFMQIPDGVDDAELPFN